MSWLQWKTHTQGDLRLLSSLELGHSSTTEGGSRPRRAAVTLKQPLWSPRHQRSVHPVILKTRLPLFTCSSTLKEAAKWGDVTSGEARGFAHRTDERPLQDRRPHKHALYKQMRLSLKLRHWCHLWKTRAAAGTHIKTHIPSSTQRWNPSVQNYCIHQTSSTHK